MLKIICLIAAIASVQSYTPEHIQEVARTDYEAAMTLADEGLRSGQLSAYTANMLRAQLTYLHTGRPRALTPRI